METIALAPTLAPLQQFRAGLADISDKVCQGRRSRRAMHASRDSPCHSSAKPPPLEGLSPSHGAFQEHAAHLVEWSTTLSSKGSAGTCIPEGVATFFHAAFTAHSGSDAGAEAVGGQLQGIVGRPQPPSSLVARAPLQPYRTWRVSGDGAPLLNKTVRLEQQHRRDGEAECVGGLEVDDQLELHGLFDRQVARLRAFQDPIDIQRCPPGQPT